MTKPAASEQTPLRVVADVNIAAIGGSGSLSPLVARTHEVFERFGLTMRLHALGTNVEGDLANVLGAIAECHRALHADGIVRLLVSVTLSSRTDRSQSIEEKIASVAQAREAMQQDADRRHVNE